MQITIGQPPMPAPAGRNVYSSVATSSPQAPSGRHVYVPVYQRALTIDLAVFGDKHPKIAIRLNNLGSAYLELGDKAKAKTYFEQSLAIKRQFYDDNHPSVQTTLSWVEGL